MSERPRRGILYSVFRHDIGRKALALFGAFVLFGVIDGQIRDEQPIALAVAYVDAADLDHQVSTATAWTLFVVQRSSPERPLVVPRKNRVRGATLHLSGSRTALRDLKATVRTFSYTLLDSGMQSIDSEDLAGWVSIERSLGTGSDVRLEIAPFRATVEVIRRLPLAPALLDTEGQPGAGQSFEKSPENVSFDPPAVELSGPEETVQQILDGRRSLFEPVLLDDVKDDEWSGTLRPRKDDPDLVDVSLESSVSATLRFTTNMVVVENSQMRLPVHIIINAEALPQDSVYHVGHQLVFEEADEDGRVFLEVELRAPERLTESLVRAEILRAQRNVLLVVLASELKTARGAVGVQIVPLPNFPEHLSVEFVDGPDKSVQLQWRDPEAPP